MAETRAGEKAHAGDTVKVRYTGKLDNGTIFDSSKEHEPFEFKLGEGQVISGFENAINGMSVGERKTIRVPAEEAYGPRREDMVIRVEKSQIPPEIELSIGTNLRIKQDSGAVIVVVTEMDKDSITLDANHPLAGNDLIFDIELLDVS